MSRRNSLFSNSLCFAALTICICLVNDGGLAARTAAQGFIWSEAPRSQAEVVREYAAHANAGMDASSAIGFLPPSSVRLNSLNPLISTN